MSGVKPSTSNRTQWSLVTGHRSVFVAEMKICECKQSECGSCDNCTFVQLSSVLKPKVLLVCGFTPICAAIQLMRCAFTSEWVAHQSHFGFVSVCVACVCYALAYVYIEVSVSKRIILISIGTETQPKLDWCSTHFDVNAHRMVRVAAQAHIG